MRIVFIIVVSHIIFSMNLSGQKVIVKNQAKVGDKLDEPNIYRTYYFKGNSVDSTIFTRDSIFLFRKRVNIESSRIELYTDSKFRFIYNVNIDTLRIKDPQDGAIMVQIYEKCDEVKGSYGLLQISKSKNEQQDISLKLIFTNKDFVNYDIIQRNDQVVLKRNPLK